MSRIILEAEFYREVSRMPFDLGTIAAVVAALLFYLRLIMLQRQRAKQLAQDRARGNKKANKNASSAASNTRLVLIKNWYLVGLGIVLILTGALISAIPTANAVGAAAGAAPYRPYWWIPVTAGILLMTLGLG